MVDSSEASSGAVGNQATAANLMKLLDANPALLTPSLTIIGACSAGRRECEELYAETESVLRSTCMLPLQPISSVANMLVRAGALTSSLEVDGHPYDGTIEDLIHDGSIPETAQTVEFVEATDLGRQVLVRDAPSKRLGALFKRKPQYKTAMVRTLELCDAHGGLKADQLESALDAEGYLYRDSRNLPTIYPSTYANYLKDAGALAWNHAWITTPLGRDVVESERFL